MRIIKEYDNVPNDIIEIKSARYIGDFAIRILFNDGSDRLVDFKSFLESSLHPSIRKYLNEELFRNFEIIEGNLNWNDFDLIFPLSDLYEGKI